MSKRITLTELYSKLKEQHVSYKNSVFIYRMYPAFMLYALSIIVLIKIFQIVM